MSHGKRIIINSKVSICSRTNSGLYTSTFKTYTYLKTQTQNEKIKKIQNFDFLLSNINAGNIS